MADKLEESVKYEDREKSAQVSCKRCLIYKRQLSMLSIHAVENEYLKRQHALCDDFKNQRQADEQKVLELETSVRQLNEQLQNSGAKLVREMALSDEARQQALSFAKQRDEALLQVNQLQTKLLQAEVANSTNNTYRKLICTMFEHKCEAELRLLRQQIQHAEAYLRPLQKFIDLTANQPKYLELRTGIEQSITVWRSYLESLRLTESGFDRSFQKQKGSFDFDVATRFQLVTRSIPNCNFEEISRVLDQVLGEIRSSFANDNTQLFSSGDARVQTNVYGASIDCTPFQTYRMPLGVPYIPPSNSWLSYQQQQSMASANLALPIESDGKMMLTPSTRNLVTMQLSMPMLDSYGLGQYGAVTTEGQIFRSHLPPRPQYAAVTPSHNMGFIPPRSVASVAFPLVSQLGFSGMRTLKPLRIEPPPAKANDSVTNSDTNSVECVSTVEAEVKEKVQSEEPGTEESEAAPLSDLNAKLDSSPQLSVSDAKNIVVDDQDSHYNQTPRTETRMSSCSSSADSATEMLQASTAIPDAIKPHAKPIKEVVARLRTRFPYRSEKLLICDLKRFRVTKLTGSDQEKLTINELVCAVASMIEEEALDVKALDKLAASDS